MCDQEDEDKEKMETKTRKLKRGLVNISETCWDTGKTP